MNTPAPPAPKTLFGIPIPTFGAEGGAGAGAALARGRVHHVSSAEQFEGILAAERGVVVLEVGFTFCKPCKKFDPTYKLFAEHYDDVLFLKVYGNRNESCKRKCVRVLSLPETIDSVT